MYKREKPWQREQNQGFWDVCENREELHTDDRGTEWRTTKLLNQKTIYQIRKTQSKINGRQLARYLPFPSFFLSLQEIYISFNRKAS